MGVLFAVGFISRGSPVWIAEFFVAGRYCATIVLRRI